MENEQHLNLKAEGLDNLKVKAAESLFDRLNDFLPRQLVIELELAFAIRPSITICCTVDRIIREYKSTELNEEKVTDLIGHILRIHFYPSAKSYENRR